MKTIAFSMDEMQSRGACDDADGRALVDVLGELAGLTVRLVECAGEKLAAIRRADSEALQTCVANEMKTLDAVLAAERKRDAIVARVAQRLQQPAMRRASMTSLAEKFSEPLRSAIHARCMGLRQAAENLQRRNRVAAEVARGLQSHVRAIFGKLAKAGQDATTYAGNGRMRHADKQLVIDALG
ncbi:MAG: flagellar export chaperone FlgN [Phycisphaerales bacterium]|nr:flagellar export chaperone FlgN [Phycisphaerales bacterium]